MSLLSNIPLLCLFAFMHRHESRDTLEIFVLNIIFYDVITTYTSLSETIIIVIVHVIVLKIFQNGP